MDMERRLIKSALKQDKAKLLLNQTIMRISKHEQFSKDSRKDAEKDFETKHHTSILHSNTWKTFSHAIGVAPLDSLELALGYAGRAAFLLHLQKYEECLRDIERAFNVPKINNSLKVKLYSLKSECLAFLNREDKTVAWRKAVFYLDKIKCRKEKSALSDFVLRAKIAVANTKPHGFNNKDKTEIIELLLKKEAEDPCEAVDIGYDNQYGRKLIAKRDFKAGEIICVQKPYVMCSNTDFSPYAYCCHCVSISWDSVPCNSCGWSLYCSENCRKIAWEQYHDVECNVMPRVRDLERSDHWKQITIRTLIIALRETGSIENLKKEVEEIDKCTDERTRGFSEDGKFEGNKFRSLYSLSHIIPKENLLYHLDEAVKVLFAFLNTSTILGEKKFKTVSELLEDEDIIFIASLILRLMTIFNINCHGIKERNIHCENKDNPLACASLRCCMRGICATPLFSLINNSCHPNAIKHFTNAQNVVLIALRPIRKDEQILEPYSGTYYNTKKADREWKFKNGFNFVCKCPACENDWPTLENKKKSKERSLPKIKKCDKLSLEEYEEIKLYVHTINRHKEVTTINLETIEKLGKAVDKCVKNFEEPSLILASLTNAIERYSKEIFLTELSIPSHCSKR